MHSKPNISWKVGFPTGPHVINMLISFTNNIQYNYACTTLDHLTTTPISLNLGTLSSSSSLMDKSLGEAVVFFKEIHINFFCFVSIELHFVYFSPGFQVVILILHPAYDNLSSKIQAGIVCNCWHVCWLLLVNH